MSVFEFQVVLPKGVAASEQLANALHEAGADDGTLFSTSGVTAVGFSREADSLEEAVRSALSDVSKAGVNAIRVEAVDNAVYDQINSELAASQ